MPDRRVFIAGMLAASLTPGATWADVGNPAFLSAARKPNGSFVLCGLSKDGQITFELPLPDRGHAAAGHPRKAEAVAFARRPGTFAIVLDCASGREIARLHAPSGRHFYGHGAFSADGTRLFTTENEYDAARGVIGVWDVENGYTRIGEFGSGGVGPHDIKLMPGGEMLVVANGGIETHPEAGRTKLNIPTMRSNLSYLDSDGKVIARLELDPAHQKNSIRHLAVAQDGSVAFAMQWQGDLTENLPLLGLHHQERQTLHLFPEANIDRMHGYLGSVAMSPDGNRIATTSPRAGLLKVFSRKAETTEIPLKDICGVAQADNSFIISTGSGLVGQTSGEKREYQLAWDNHLISV